MKYAIMVYETADQVNERDDPAKAPAYWGSYHAYSQALVEAGVAAGGAGLQPITMATSLRLRDGKRLVQDGPFVDTKEQLGGFFLIDVPDLDTALEWASRCPSVNGCGVEVRPLLPPPPTA